jgi:hypothetical protein
LLGEGERDIHVVLDEQVRVRSRGETRQKVLDFEPFVRESPASG